MNEQKLSKRLAAVANHVPKKARLADIGTDHAYLPVNLVLNGKIDYAIASDVVKGPYESAVEQIKKSGVEDKVHARLASGLDGLRDSDKIDAITICGMGGALIAEILRDGYASKHLKGTERLILQPNVSSKNIREWLMYHHYELVTEEILEENEKIYEILVAQKGKMSLTDEELLFGPFLMKEKHPAFRQKWQAEFEKNKYVIKQLKSATVIQHDKIAEFEELNRKIQEVLA
ncbi:MAG: tRNA (adenine(22)-N(1))-methyltransferase TrmK [Streptococcaceae bacterium]|jgi:tRNA (adenine22-N1)-methyltransferase|nr:tRNA (adenine(22)-N(1))-methyltransferase TrmK [Streptococcaceae bacterium]